MRSGLTCLLIAMVFSIIPAASQARTPPVPTRILDPVMAGKLKENKGITLQWIDWDRRGTVWISDTDGEWALRAAQSELQGPGALFLDGRIVEIGADYFLFDGIVRITNTPGAGRTCEKRAVWRFAVTQNRPYWRIRQFEWCDGLTDYIDIYF